jgi:hypothetical protein
VNDACVCAWGMCCVDVHACVCVQTFGMHDMLMQRAWQCVLNAPLIDPSNSSHFACGRS